MAHVDFDGMFNRLMRKKERQRNKTAEEPPKVRVARITDRDMEPYSVSVKLKHFVFTEVGRNGSRQQRDRRSSRAMKVVR